MLSMYPACFYKEAEGYSVVFPDLNNLATQGDTFEEAMEMAVDCLAGYLYTCKRDGETIPTPSRPGSIDPIAVSRLPTSLFLKHLSMLFLLTWQNMQNNTSRDLSKRHFPSLLG
jgi:predicted RNase H-like HicB family nuclease